jgi:hypothetical protein
MPTQVVLPAGLESPGYPREPHRALTHCQALHSTVQKHREPSACSTSAWGRYLATSSFPGHTRPRYCSEPAAHFLSAVPPPAGACEDPILQQCGQLKPACAAPCTRTPVLSAPRFKFLSPACARSRAAASAWNVESRLVPAIGCM